MPGDPNWNPDADLDGDDEVTLFDFGILTRNFGLIGAEEFAGSAQSASGNWSATLRVELGDWTAQTSRAVYVLLQLKRVGTESDPNTPIYERVVSFGQGEVEKDVSVSLPFAGIYTVRALAYNDADRTDISHWLRSELEGFVVPQGGGSALPDVPPPVWAQDTVPTDTVSAGSFGPSSADYVNLASGVFEYRPPADLVVYNPIGPAVSFARTYRSKLAEQGYASPGLSPGWVHHYDVTLSGVSGSWGVLTLRYPNGATEQLTPVLDSNGEPTGDFQFNNAPYLASGQPGGYPGRWNRIVLTFKDESKWIFTPSYDLDLYRLTRFENLLGQGVNIIYDTSNRLLRLENDAGVALLSFSYVNGLSLSDYTGRTVTYTFTGGQLSAVSQVSSSNPLWVYGYQVVNGVPYLVSVGCADPVDGSGTRTHPVMYDAQGKVVLLQDANGNVRSYNYEGGFTTVTLYNTDGSLAHRWTQKIGSLNVDAGLRDAQGRETSVSYTGYRPVQVINRNGQSTTFSYDALFNLTAVAPPRVPPVQYEYEYNPTQFPLGRLVRVSQGSRTPTEFEYYPNGLLYRVRVPKPGTAGSGDQVQFEYLYTSLGNLLEVRLEVRAPSPNPQQSVRTTRYFYERDPFTGYAESERLNCPLAVAVYDGAFNPNNVNDRLLYRVSFRYDAQGRTTQVIDAGSNVTEITYNAAGQVWTVTYPAESETQRRDEYLYSAIGGQLRKKVVRNLAKDPTDQVEQEINLSAGGEGELQAQTGGVQSVQFVRDATYRLVGLRDGRDNILSLNYDPRGFLQSRVYPRGDTYQFDYDFEGNVISRTDPDGVVVEYVRSSVDSRIEQVDYPGMNMDILVSYDNYNRVVELSNRVATISYTYDDGDRLLSESVTYADMPDTSFVVSYQYRPDGSLQSITAPYRLVRQGEQYVAQYGTYQYNYGVHTGQPFSPGEQIDAVMPWGIAAKCFADRRGLIRRQEVWSGNTLVMRNSYSYNQRGLLRSLTNVWKDGSALSTFTFITYDAVGNCIRIGSMSIEQRRPAAGMYGELTYKVDALTRRHLLSEQFLQMGYDILSYQFFFGYDDADNLTTIRGLGNISYNANNQIVRSGFEYDPNGNATLFDNMALGYDYENRVVDAGGMRMAYRPDGKRAWKQPSGTTSRVYYLYAGEFVLFEFNPSNGYHQAYGYGANGLVSSWRQNTVRLYAFDPWGNLTNRATPATVLSNTWIDSYGGIVYDDSVGSGEPFPSPDSVAYRGQWGAYTDVENWGLHLRGDYYSARWGRWLTRQSAGVNEYSGGVNPVASWIDPLQDLLSLVGIFDPSGLVDLVNAGVYALRGRWAEAAVSAVAIVPVVGDVAKVGTVANKLACGGARHLRRLYDQRLFFQDIRSAGEWEKIFPRGVRKEAGLDVHHLIEKRFATRLGLDPKDIPAVVLDRTFHQKEVTAKLFKALPTYPKRRYEPQKIWDAYVEVYREIGHSEWLEAIWPYFERWG